MKTSFFLFAGLVMTGVSACSPSASDGPSLNAAARAQIDCLAAQTVLTITTTVRDGLAAGESTEALRSVDSDAIDASTSLLTSRISQPGARAYFNDQVQARLDAVQAAINDPGSEAKSLMDETYDLAASCKFEGA